MNTENTYFTRIYLYHLTTALTKAPDLDFQHAYIPPTTVSAQSLPGVSAAQDCKKGRGMEGRWAVGGGFVGENDEVDPW